MLLEFGDLCHHATVCKENTFIVSGADSILLAEEAQNSTNINGESAGNGSRETVSAEYSTSWPMKVTNEELYCKAKTAPVGETIQCRRWRWIGHTLRQDQIDNSKVALTWAPEGKRKGATENNMAEN